MLELLKIYPDAKGVPGSMVIRITATRQADRQQLQQNADNEKAAYDSIYGLELEYEILEDRYTVDRIFRYSEVDLVQLTQTGFFGEDVLQAPTYISLQVTLDQFVRDGYSCDF